MGKNLHLVGCATVCGKSEVMLTYKDSYRELDTYYDGKTTSFDK